MFNFACMENENNALPKVNRKLPTKFIPVNRTIARYGRLFKCVLRPPVETLDVQDACKGCWFARTHRDDRLTSNCNAVQCSSFDRKDGKNVWFKLVFEDE